MERYDSYKDSGVDWIGEVPSHWNVKRLQWISDIENSGVWGEDDPFDGANEVPIPTTAQLSIEGRWDYDGMAIRYLSDEEREKYLCRVGDIIVVKSSGSATNIITGKCGYIDEGDNRKFGFSNFLLRVRTNKKFHSRLTYYFLQSNLTKQRIERMVSATTYPNLKVDEYVKSELTVPPLHEQEQIVEYLDRKTTLIDSLIEKTVRKIELLKEKRTSLINEVVTKGLNPDVEMKDSGVKWIGEIPSHWGVSKLKYSSQVLPSNVDKHIFPDEIQVRLCNYTDVYYNEKIDDSLQLKEGSCTESEFKKFLLIKGDVIVTKDSESPDDIGIPTLVNSDFEDVVCGYHLTLFRPYRVHGGYLFRFIQSTGTRRYFEVNSNGITRFSLGKSTLEDLIHPTPPQQEQEQIVEYLDEQTSIIDSTITTEERRIELLKEYRQSLISEVVTGKVKVTRDE